MVWCFIVDRADLAHCPQALTFTEGVCTCGFFLICWDRSPSPSCCGETCRKGTCARGVFQRFALRTECLFWKISIIAGWDDQKDLSGFTQILLCLGLSGSSKRLEQTIYSITTYKDLCIKVLWIFVYVSVAFVIMLMKWLESNESQLLWVILVVWSVRHSGCWPSV